jgi:hypothetical protein
LNPIPTKMEVLLFFGLFLALALWSRFYKALFHAHSFHPSKMHRTLLAIFPVACVLCIAVVLWRWSSPDVRSSKEWIFLYTMNGAAWLCLGLYLLSLFGVGVREDVLERQNPAAAWVVYGTLIGTTFCYAGANIGTGPGMEVVLFCAAVATACLFGFWFFLERFFQLADRVTIERDEAAGIRIGGWVASLGMVFGGAVVGDWESLRKALRDFVDYAWVALLFLLVAVVIEWFYKSQQENPRRGTAAAISAAYILAGAVYVVWRSMP